MTDNIYVFETLRAAGTTVVFDNNGGIDWIFLTGSYAPVSGHSGPSISMLLADPIYGISTAVWVYDSPTTFYSITFVGGMENIRGSDGDDQVDGNNIANVLMGDPTEAAGGRDWLRGNGGNDTLLGVGGSDILWGGDGDDLIYGDNDPFSQDQGNFASGDDSMRGDTGNDTMFGGYGNNTLDGGTGLDTADYSGFFNEFGYAVFVINANMDTGRVAVTQTDEFGDSYVVANDTLIGFESIVGSVGNDTITARNDIALPVDTTGTIWGGAGNDELRGGRFLDLIYGGEGNDTLYDGGISIPLGGGNDLLAGGAGNDFCYVQSVNTVVLEFANQGIDTVISTVSYTLGANVEHLGLSNFVATPTDGTGNTLGNWLVGNYLGNMLTGLDGSDTLNGEGAADTLRGGSSFDFLYGGDGGDQLFGGTENDMLSGEAGADGLDGGAGNDNLTGGSDNDTLFGRTEDDTLSGGGGDDRLQGGTGRDRMTGGTGRDTFVFLTADEAGNALTRDIITDFAPGLDKLNLSKIATGQVFIANAAFSHTAGEIRYDASRGILSGDLDGDRTADWQITLQGAPALTAGDLIL